MDLPGRGVLLMAEQIKKRSKSSRSVPPSTPVSRTMAEQVKKQVRRQRTKSSRSVRAQNRINTLRTPYLRSLGRAIQNHHLAKLDTPPEQPKYTPGPTVSADQAIAEIDSILAEIRDLARKEVGL